MKMAISIILLLLSISFGHTIFADQNLTDIYKNIYIDPGDNKYTLNPSQGINFFGRYEKRLEDLAGIQLHLFPDSKFIFTYWCDICREKMIANGTYTFKNGKISLKFNYKNKEYKKDLTNDSFHVLEGRIELEGGGVMGFISILVDEKGLNRLSKQVDRKQDYYMDYMIRKTEYYDWQNIYNKLMNDQK